MADTKISALSAAASLTGAEKIPMVQSGADVAATPEQFGMISVHPGYVAARWYSPLFIGIGGGTALTTNGVTLIPFIVPKRITISDLAVRITTAATGGHIRLGIYNSSST